MRGGGLAHMALAALAAGCLDAPGDGRPAAGGDASTASDAGDPLAVGLVAWFPMDELDGGDGIGVAPDATGGGDGSCFEPGCPVLVTGHLGDAYSYDGSDDEVIVPDRAAFHSASGTAAVWIYPTASGTMILSKPYGTQDGNSWLLFFDADGSILFETAGLRTVSEMDLVDLGRWTHVAMTWSPVSNQLYIDGEYIENGGSGTAFDGNAVILGADHDFGDQVLPMYGMLDDARVYDRALTGDEIARLAAM